MSRSGELFLQDIEEAGTKIQRYTNGLDFEAFVGHEMAYDAVLRNLEIIGEAAKGIPGEVRDRFPSIDGRGMAGLRDILAHAYFALDEATLWDIIQNKIPQLLTDVRAVRKVYTGSQSS